ncbi:MAG: hypothetical protein AAF483_08525 [Planctomycetota bacterium]
MRTVAFGAALIFFSVAFSPASKLSAQTIKIPEGNQEFYNWLDAMGVPDTTDADFVEVTRHWGDSEYKTTFFAFLLEESETTLRILDGDLKTETLKKSAASPQYPEVRVRYTYEKKDLVEFGEKERKSELTSSFTEYGGRMSRCVSMAMFSRVCAAQGHNLLANRLLFVAVGDAERRQGGGAPMNLTFTELLKREIAHGKTWEGITRFGDIKHSRQDLLQYFQGIKQEFPEHENAERVAETIRILKRMVVEDEKRFEAGETSDLSGEQLVADLIFRLRDQNGQQFSQPGSCDIFWNDRPFMHKQEKDPTKYSPAWQLKKLGVEAVPLLIEALDDDSFTRSVGFHRDFYFSHSVLRVSDCAERILGEIAGRSFYVRQNTAGTMSKDAKNAGTKKQVESWWKDYQDLGELAVLRSAVEKGDRNSASQAVLLAKRYPESAIKAIELGLQSSSEAWNRVGMLQATESLPNSIRLHELLIRQMREAAELYERVEAAKMLAKRGSSLALQEMKQQWRERVGLESKKDRELVRVVWFFEKHGDVESIDLMRRHFFDTPIEIRIAEVDALGEWFQRVNLAEQSGDESAKLRRALLRFLQQALKDKERKLGYSGSRGGYKFINPRVCDFAAYFLSQADFNFEFESNAPQWKRDLQQAKIDNQIRLSQGYPAQKIQEPQRNEGLPEEKIAPLLDGFVTAIEKQQPQNWQRFGRLIEALGYRSMPAIQKRVERVAEEERPEAQSKAVETELRKLFQRVANRVEQVDVLPLSGEPQSRSFLLGKSLSGEVLIDAMIGISKSLKGDTRGFTLILSRDERLLGVIADLRFTNVAPAEQNSSGTWLFNRFVSVGETSLEGSYGTIVKGAFLNPKTHREMIQIVDKVLVNPPGEEVLIEIQVYRDK